MEKGFTRVKKKLLVDMTNSGLIKDIVLDVRFLYHNTGTKYKNNKVFKENVESIFVTYDIGGLLGLRWLDFINAEKDGIAEEEAREMTRKLRNSEIKFYIYPCHIELDRKITDELEKKGFEKHIYYQYSNINLTELTLKARKNADEIRLKYGHLLNPKK